MNNKELEEIENQEINIRKRKKLQVGRIVPMVILMLFLLTACNVKEGQTTFGSLEDKIDDYLIAFDVSDMELKEDSMHSGVIGYFDQGQLKYKEITLADENQFTKYEIFFIDASLIYMTEYIEKYDPSGTKEKPIVSEESYEEYIFLDTMFADYNPEEEMIVERQDSEKYKELLVTFDTLINKINKVNEGVIVCQN
jgi:uncharacterized protein YqkB